MSAETLELRRLTNESVEDSEYTDAMLESFVAAHASMNKAAAYVWRLKAAKYADLVTMSEGNSSRQWSSAYKQALEMAKSFEQLADEESPTAGRPTAVPRKIVRT